MAVPHYTYLVLKMPGPRGIITVKGSFEVSDLCDREFHKMAVLSWDTRHDHYSPILCFIHVLYMQVTHICWEIFQPLFADQRPPHDKFRLRGYNSLGKPLVLGSQNVFNTHILFSRPLLCYFQTLPLHRRGNILG
jgi:hypothetical protein